MHETPRRLPEPARLAVLLSGSGSTYANLADACARGEVPGRIAVVIASKPGLAGVAKAEQRGHPVVIASQPAAVTAALQAHQAEWVIMAGWLKYYDPPAPWAGRTVNVHPSLLPAYGGRGMYGQHVHAAVLAGGETRSGCTVHDVSGAYDSGQMLAQAVVSVHPHDTPAQLAARVQAAERALYPTVIAHCLRAGRTVPLQPIIE